MYDANPSRLLRPKFPKPLVQFRLRQEIRRAKRKRTECAKRNKSYRLQESFHLNFSGNFAGTDDGISGMTTSR